MASLPVIKIAFADIPFSFAEIILDLVKDYYEFDITTSKDADFVLHSVGGHEVLKYSGVRIFVTGENVCPNFQISDYSLSFEKLTFGDRSAWLPLIKLYKDAYNCLKEERRDANEVLDSKSEFCAYVMSNSTGSAIERELIFNKISSYKKVNSGGKWRNNTGVPVLDKLQFQRKHKFVIAFENYSYPGYLTEKFAEAAYAEAIPIYWGDPKIEEVFNTNAFINCHDYNSFDEVVEEIKRLDNDNSAYCSMIIEPWFKNGEEPENLSSEHYVKFLRNIFDQSPKDAYRRNLGRWGLKIEKQFYQMAHKPGAHALYIIQKWWHRLRRGNL